VFVFPILSFAATLIVTAIEVSLVAELDDGGYRVLGLVLLPQYVSHVHARVPRGRRDNRGSATDCRALVARRGPSSLDIATGMPSALGQPCEFVDNRAVLQGADAKCQS
jgi:hypothetical protein